MVSKYTTLELINDLKTELQRFPEELALLFPERVEKFKHRHLSIFWKKSQGYISKVISKIENNKQYFRFLDDEDGLKKLEKINFKEFGLKRRKCISLIENYRNNNITILEFIKNWEGFLDT